MPPRKGGPNRTLDILSSIGDQEFLGAEVMQNLRDHGLRVERIAISLIRPDAAQPRRVLPESIHQAFHHQELTPVQALKQYIEKVKITARQKGRPFENLLDLLTSLEDAKEEVNLPPPERDLRDLTNLAVTLRQDGQVNPLTIIDCTQGAMPSYLIETGERRYWANYIDMEFIPGYQGDGTIPCIILPPGEASVFRQAKENTSRAGLNAIGMARQAALLLLAVHDIHSPIGVVSHDFYRQAIDLDLRGKREFTTDILAAMGGINRGYFSYCKALLKLSDEALELADQHNLEEARLRYVVNLPLHEQVEMIRQIIDHNLTSRQIKDICEQGLASTSDDDPEDPLPRSAIQVARLTKLSLQTKPEEFALALSQQEPDLHSALARLGSLRDLIDRTETLLRNG